LCGLNWADGIRKLAIKFNSSARGGESLQIRLRHGVKTRFYGILGRNSILNLRIQSLNLQIFMFLGFNYSKIKTKQTAQKADVGCSVRCQFHH
jgi:hypothetical protein